MDKIIVENVTKIFGEDESLGVELVEKGLKREQILKDHNVTVGVNRASFTIKEGEIFVIMGLSGSGKSTMVRILNRLIEPSAGRILFDGVDVTKLDAEELIEFRRKKMSMVFQSFALMPHLNILENTALGLEFAQISKEEREKRAYEQLEKVGLAQWHLSKPDELSGGMKQRVGLARALTVSPEVLLMDEAFSALDPLIRSEMQDELLKIHKEDKRTIVFISHDLDEALKIGDRIAIMNGGEVVQVGTPKEILLNPADEYVRAFFKGVDSTGVISAKEIVNENTAVVCKSSEGPYEIKQMLEEKNKEYAYITEDNGSFVGVVAKKNLETDTPLNKQINKEIGAVDLDMSMKDILADIANEDIPLPVIDSRGVFKGVISKKDFLNELTNLNGVSNV